MNITFGNKYWTESPSFTIARRLRAMLMAIIGHDSDTALRQAEFIKIIRDYGNMISGICFSFAIDENDAADLRQDILLNIWKGLSNYRRDSSLSTWLYRVALNTCVSTIRRRSRRPITIALDGTGEYCQSPEEEESDRIEWLYSRISQLPPIDRAIVTMRLDDRSYDEIAQVIGISRNNVAVRLNRIKRRLSESGINQV